MNLVRKTVATSHFPAKTELYTRFLPLVRSRMSPPELQSLLIEVTAKVMKLTEHKKVKRSPWGSLPNGTGARVPVPQQKALKTYAGNQTVMSQGYEPRSPGGTNHFLNKAKERLLGTV